MKNIKFTTVAFWLAVAAAFAACNKEESPDPIDPTVRSVEVSNVSKTTANVTASIHAGGHEIAERGFCYNTSGEPTVSDLKHTVDEKVTVLGAVLRDLQALTTYYVRAYVITEGNKVWYSPRSVSFTTEFNQTTLSTVNGFIPYTRSISVEIFAVADEETPIVKRGVTVSPSENRNDPGAQTVFADGAGNGNCSVIVEGLSAETTYHVWSFAETESEDRVYSLRSWKVTTVAIAKPISTIVGQTVQGTSTLSGSHRITLDVRVTDSGDPGTTISEAGIVWSKTEEPELGGSGVGKQADERLKTLSNTVSIVAAGLENNTTYYFRSYAVNSDGITAYGAEKSYKTRPERFFDDARDFLQPATGRKNSMYYSRTTSPVDDFQLNDSRVGSIALQNAFAADGLRWSSGSYQDYMYYVFHIRQTAEAGGENNFVGDSLMVLIVQYQSDAASTANYNRSAYFGWKVSLDKATGIMTLRDFIYKPTFENTTTSYATDLMDSRPNVGEQLTKYFTWLTGVTSAPRRIQFDYYNSTSTSGNGHIMMMPLDGDQNPEYDYLRFATGGWGGRQYPVWP